MKSENLVPMNIKIIMAIGLALNVGAWFIPDITIPTSHWNDSSWVLHSRYHVGATSSLNLVYTVIALVITFTAKTNAVLKVQFAATGLAIWNFWALFFAVAIIPFILGPDDIHYDWAFNPYGTHAGSHVAIEGGVILMAGLPAVVMAYVAWKLRRS